MMMRQVFLLLAAVALIAGSGCKMLEKNCTNCGQKQARMQQAPQQVMQAQAQQMMQAQAMSPANPTIQQEDPAGAAYAYPYYTVRGPRDFFMKNPPSLGN